MRSSSFFSGALLAAALLTSSAAAQDAYVLTTMAGNPSQGYGDGKGSSARFALPEAIAAGPGGSVYVSDFNNSVIRKITSDGTVTTIAGVAGRYGYQDGPASTALFVNVFGMVVDANGVIFLTDSSSNTVRRIGSDGTVNTFAGKPGVSGSADGPADDARFNRPRGLAIDAAGNLYVADTGNATIRKITPNGTVSTLAGTAEATGSADGTGAAARFRAPYGIATDQSGNVYVSDWDDATIRKITPAGVVTTLAGSPGIYDSVDGPPSIARFDTPSSLVVDSQGNIYITDRNAQTIRKISTSGNVSTLTGMAYMSGFKDGISAQFNAPSGITISADGATLYVADSHNGTIRRVTTTGSATTLAGAPGAGTADGRRASARLFNPGGMAFDAAGTLYIADTYNHTIRKMSPDGTISTVAGLAGSPGSANGTATTSRFAYPYSVTVDAVGNLYVSDFSNDTIRKITPNGLVGTLAGLPRVTGHDDGTGPLARFNAPADMKMDSGGNIVVVDKYNHTIRRITPAGVVTTIAGQAGVSGSTNGPANEARFRMPSGIAFDAAGNLYITDEGNHVVRKLTPDGTVTTLAGLAGQPGDADGIGSSARFRSPTGITIDPAGNLFVTDSRNHMVRKITPAGAVTTVVGFGYAGYTDGIEHNAGLFHPTSLTSDTAGNLYIADTFNCTIRKASVAKTNTPTSRMINLSVRAIFEPNERLIAGFVVSGPPQPMLVRAIGPGLAPFVGGAQTANDPKIEMYDDALNMVHSNEDWPSTSTFEEAFNRVGAFGLARGSRDAATLRDISGLQSVHVITPAGGMGLVEAYDAGSAGSSRLINVSARYKISTGTGVLVAGFVIEGTHHKTVLIRGVGPTLAAFGIQSAVANPKLELYNANEEKIAENEDWQYGLAGTFSAVSAFDFVSGSKDAALLISLPPGQYTAQLSGGTNDSGEGLIEVYEVGN